MPVITFTQAFDNIILAITDGIVTYGAIFTAFAGADAVGYDGDHP